jgi:hypothetical protein
MATKNIVIRKNATLQLTVTYTDTTGNEVDLTGAAAKLQIRNAKGGTKLYYTATEADDIAIDGGVITLTIPVETTSTFSFSNGVYDLVVTMLDDKATVILEGKVSINDGVTR